MPNETAIEILPPAPLAGGARPPDDLLATLEARQRLMERVLSYAISATHPGQWQMLGDKPWPTGPACEAMARRCGVSWDRPECEKRDTSDEEGPAYTWTYRARFFLPGGIDSIWAEGHCSSRDQFLGTGQEYETRDFTEVEEGNIRQAAMTNLIVNGVTRLLGVRNLTKERLDELLGAGASEKMGKVKYDTGAKGGGRSKSADDVDLRFGRGKDKKLSEVSDDDVRWYISCWEKDLADESKSKYHANSKRSIEIAQKLLAERANAKAGHQAPAGGDAPSVWQRILALPEAKGVGEQDLKAVLKKATGKSNAGELVEDDIGKAKAGLAEFRKATGAGADIPF